LDDLGFGRPDSYPVIVKSVGSFATAAVHALLCELPLLARLPAAHVHAGLISKCHHDPGEGAAIRRTKVNITLNGGEHSRPIVVQLNCSLKIDGLAG